MEGETEEPVRDLNELQNSDWVRAVPWAYRCWMHSDCALLVQGSHKPWLTMCCVYFPQARFWVQAMRDLRHGVKLKKVQERQYNPLPIEFQLTPYEMLMDDIRSKRYKLRKVTVSVHMYKSWGILNWVMSASMIKIYFWISPWTNNHESFFPLYQQYSRTLQLTFIAVCCRDHKPQQCLLCLSGIKQAYFWSCRVEKGFIGLNWMKWMTLKTVN